MNDPLPRCYECESDAYFARVRSGDLPMEHNTNPCVTLCAKHAVIRKQRTPGTAKKLEEG